MPNANTLIATALRLIGALASGETPTAAEANDALAAGNRMLDVWNAEKLMIFTIQRVTQDANNNVFNLTPGQQAYTVGTGGNFNIPRPPRIDRVGIVQLSNPAQPLELALEMLDDVGWENVPVKAITSTLPQKVWDDKGFPLRTLNFWCIPQIQVQATLYIWQQLSQFPDLVTTLTFPPAYEEALVFNWAIRLAPEFGRSIPAEVAAVAISSKAVVKSFNIEPPKQMSCDPAVVRGDKQVYNWLTDMAAGGRT